MKKLTVSGLIFIAIAIFLWGFSDHVKTRVAKRDSVLEARARLEEKAKEDSTKRVYSALEKLLKINNLEELEKFVKDTEFLAKGEREAIDPVLRAKLFEANFRRAELYLTRAGDLLRADKDHPAGHKYIERAQNLYAKMEKLMEAGIPERLDDARVNARLNYLKGVYYFRLLIFIKNPKEEAARVEELIGQSAKHFSAVFAYLPRDRDSEVAIEILQKKAKDMNANSGAPAKTRLELLPSDKGPTFMIEGIDKGRN
ncbi:MAG: hypothetical protein HYV51_00910 [Parcubacteria group bacterium]|nr:hypothetical protein [Parcubacteria group bacterium]